MKPIERFQALLDGKKIRRTVWRLAPDECLSTDDINEIRDLLDDLFDPDISWAIYQEPKDEIKLTPDMVGRKVRLRSRSIVLITRYNPELSFWFNENHSWNENGRQVLDMECAFDIVAILPEGE